jgi:hypothetical protein
MKPKLPRNQLKERLGPGIWIDQEGTPHWSIPELLAMVDLPDTPENRDAVKSMLRATMLKANPQATIIEREKFD